MHYAAMRSRDGDGDVPHGPPSWEPPDNEVPALLAGPVLLNRSDEGALLLLSARLFSVGLELMFGLRLRSAALVSEPHAYPRWSAMLLGVELGDGRRVLAGDRGAFFASEDAAHLTERGGGGGGRSYETTFWLSPAPPAGDLVLHTACVPLGLAESSHLIDAPTLAAARAAIVELWPWEPEPDYSILVPPAPREVPPGGWFEETAARG
jgi:hypothetical protein